MSFKFLIAANLALAVLFYARIQPASDTLTQSSCLRQTAPH